MTSTSTSTSTSTVTATDTTTGPGAQPQTSQTPDTPCLVDPTKTMNNVTCYNYRGGQTTVVTGGVMLGIGSPHHESSQSRRGGNNEGGAKKALSRGKGSYNAGGVGKKLFDKHGSDAADWRKHGTQ